MSTLDEIVSRPVYGILGIPIDRVDIPDVLARIDAASRSRSRLLISTVNLNFLMASQKEAVFKKSLIISDLCTADGAPIVWLSRLLGVPIPCRVAGSDIFEAMRTASREPPLKAFLFGGEQGVAAAAASKINSHSQGLTCVGSMYPSFGSVDQMSSDAILNALNNSGADFLSVSLGASKGQQWLVRNDPHLRIPVRAHLGATINFQAGTVARAPPLVRKLGFEWLWRIKEEPHLWRRYVADGGKLLELVIARVLPIVLLNQWDKITGRYSCKLRVTACSEAGEETLSIEGALDAKSIPMLKADLRRTLDLNHNLTINCAKVTTVDPRFLGLLVVLNKVLKARGNMLTLVNVPRGLLRRLRLHGFEDLAGKST